MTSEFDREPTDDERAGMTWFNALPSNTQRSYWMDRAARLLAIPYASPAQAWALFKSLRCSDD